MKIGQGINKYGTHISLHICGDCGSRFTVCPPADDDWGGCQAEGCASYDIARDADRLFDNNDARLTRETKH